MQGYVVLPPGVASCPAAAGPSVAAPGASASRLRSLALASRAEAVPVPELSLAPAAVSRGQLLSAQHMALALAALLALNVLDGVMTLWAVRVGVATEANPLMAAALELGGSVFLFAKLGVVAAGCAVLWYARDRRVAQIGACLCVAVYAALALVHLLTGALIADALGVVGIL